MPYVTVEVDVGDVIQDITTDQLQEELVSRQQQGRGSSPLASDFDPVTGKNSNQLLEAVYEARRAGDNERALELIDRLIYAAIGRIV